MKTKLKKARSALIATLLFVSVTSSACGANDDSSGKGQDTSMVQPAEDLSIENLVGAWTLTAATEKGQVMDLPASEVDLSIDADGQVQFSTGCNTIAGAIKIQPDDVVSFQDGPQTLVACPEDIEKVETLIGGVMQTAYGATLTQSGELTLLGEAGTLVLQKQ